MTDLMASLNVNESVTKTTTNRGTLTLENRINERAKEVVHEMLLEEFPNNYKKLENTTLLKVDKDNNLKTKNKKGEEIQPNFDFQGYCVLIPQDKTTIKNGKHTHSIDSGFRVGVMQTYLQGSKTTICEFVTIDGKKVSSIIKK